MLEVNYDSLIKLYLTNHAIFIAKISLDSVNPNCKRGSVTWSFTCFYVYSINK